MIQYTNMRGAITCCLILLFASPAYPVDTAFWKPYKPDKKTLLLEHFDSTAPEAQPGKFGQAWQGPAAWQQKQPGLLISSWASLEAWVKLDKLPEKRAYIIHRPYAKGTTKGFELFIEPSGALGIAVSNTLGNRAALLSDPGVVQVGVWQHLAGITRGANELFVDGHKVARVLFDSSSGRGLGGDRTKETKPARITVAEGVPGLVDEVRVHRYLAKFWPKPQHPWMARVMQDGLPDQTQVLLADTKPVLHLSFDQDLTPAINTKEAKAKGSGQIVDQGVRGKAFEGPLAISGALSSAQSGALEFWSQPQGYCNLMDQNRTLLHTSLFSFYFWNSSHGLRPLALYYRVNKDGKLALYSARDSLATEVYSGQWYHYVFSWSNGRVTAYINGRKSLTMAAKWEPEALTLLNFSPYGFGAVDEVYVYDKGLTELEAANTYWRYVDPTKLEKPRDKVANLKWWHLPTSRTLYTQIQPAAGTDPTATPKLVLKTKQGQPVFQADAKFGAEYQRFILPKLDGEYRIAVQVNGKQSPPQIFKRQRFAWEGNQLGVSNKVYPPFRPIQVKDKSVSVVCRDLTMNHFGLWDSVQAQGQEILAAPMTLQAMDEQGQALAWTAGQVTKTSAKPHLAEFTASATCPAVKIETLSAIEMDGMMKVSMKLVPVEGAVPLSRLSLTIPLKPKVARLMQEIGWHCRSGYTGKIPALKPGGDGTLPTQGPVWTSKQSTVPGWLNTFTCYVWLGGVSRGLCWFADNDKGWLTAKNHDRPLQQILRSPEAVTLRVDLVNIPGKITKPTELVFGVQASPTKPLPKDFRTKAKTLPDAGIPVHPWGGLSCSWKSPWLDKWEVVDKVVESRLTGTTDWDWFKAFVEKYDPPPVHGKRPWLKDIGIFVSKVKAPECPDHVYFEEMAVLPFLPEYHVFQDEWSHGRLQEKSYPSVDIYRESGGREINPNARVNYGTSYQNYTLSLMNEWWKRGVSIYWDNTYPRVVSNPWTSDAYETPDGRIQPSRTIWNQRAYMKRTWNLMHYWREKGVARPLDFIVHMTNCNALPLFTWSTCNYDMELSQSIYAKTHPDHYTPGEPFTPEYLQATSMAQQVGNYPYLVHDLFQSSLPAAAWGLADTKTERGRRSWGMRMVHEIISGGPSSKYNKAIYHFGYGRDDVQVWNYWDISPAFVCDNQEVKCLLLTRAKDKKMLLVAQSYSKQPIKAQVRFDPARIGFAPQSHALDGITNQHFPMKDNTLTVSLDFPYDNRVLLIGVPRPSPKVVFSDQFDDWCHPGWDYLSSSATFTQGKLRFGKNSMIWRGHQRVFKYLDLPDLKDPTLGFTFQIEQVPASKTKILVAGLGNEVKWSKHGLSHSEFKTEVTFLLTADPEQGWVWSALTRRDGKLVHLGKGMSGALDTQPRLVLLTRSAEGQYVLRMGDQEVLTFEDPEATTPIRGFTIVALDDPAKTIGALLLDDIALCGEKPDFAPLQARRQQALASAREVVAAQVDELKRLIVDQFGVFGSNPVYSLAMFRNPEKDVAELLTRIRAEGNAGRRHVLLAVLRELPKRHHEHLTSMKAIGQPAHRDPLFKKARTQAATELQNWQAPKGATGAKAKTLKVLVE